MQFGLFHGDPHPGNIFALRDGRIGYVDFGNVAELSQRNKQTLIDAVVHAVNEDYKGMADDFVQLVSRYHGLAPEALTSEFLIVVILSLIEMRHSGHSTGSEAISMIILQLVS